MDIDETNQVASIQNITQVFNEEQKFPEMDAYLVSALYADWLAAGCAADTTAITVDNILTVFDGYMTPPPSSPPRSMRLPSWTRPAPAARASMCTSRRVTAMCFF